ncbi:MAG: 3'-5' exoribonuclease [Actinomycetota bacterium]|nr:3'-5' exoribonuclease [Actinomycetota bacterium]
MLSIGSAAFASDGELLSTFAANLEPLPGASGHPDTMAWWSEHPDAWAAVCTNRESPDVAMRRYEGWLSELPTKPIFVGYPAGFDFTFVYWYLMRFVGSSPFGPVALDARTFAMAVLGREYRECGLEEIAAEWLPDQPHTHVAVQDAIDQGQIFCALLRERMRSDRSQGGGDA